MRLTTVSIAALKAEEKERLFFDGRGSSKAGYLAVRVRAGKTRTRRDFLFLYFVNKNKRKLSLGEFGEPRQGKMSLAEARAQFEKLSALVRAGKDPIAEREAERKRVEQQRREARRQGSFGQLFDAYIAHLRARDARSADEIQRSIEADVLPVIPRHIRAKDVVPEDIRSVMRRIVARQSRAQANKVRGYLQTIFAFGLQHDQSIDIPADPEILFGLDHNPARDIPKVSRPGETGVRDVELTAEQIRLLWSAIEHKKVGQASPTIYATKRKQGNTEAPKTIRLDGAVGACMQLLLATGGQRVEVVVAARQSEFDVKQRIWTVPHERRKNRLHAKGPHIVPLTQLAIDIIEKQLKRAGDGPYLFPALRASNRAPHMHIDVLYKGLRRWCDAIEFPIKFAPRDMRQTWMARAGELGLSKGIRDRIQDRPPSDVGAKHYDSYSYLTEKTAAMQAWDKRLKEIAAGTNKKPAKSGRQ